MSDATKMSAQYNADVDAMAAAARSWKRAHPHAELRFVRLELPNIPAGKKVVIIAPLDASVIAQVSGNAITADLLATLDKAAVHGNGATLLQAEAVIEHVFGVAAFAHGGWLS